MEKRKCEECKYYCQGECFYNPPTPVFDNYAYEVLTMRPYVRKNDLCSKWEINPNKI